MKSRLRRTVSCAPYAAAALLSAALFQAVPTSAEDMTAQGKIFCSVERLIGLPYEGIVNKMLVEPGRYVEKGQPLMRYEFSPDTRLDVRRSVARLHLNDLEIILARQTEQLASASALQEESRKLAMEGLVSSQKLSQLVLDLDLLTKQRETTAKRLSMERRISEEYMTNLTNTLGEAVTLEDVPEEVSLMSPASGHVIWIAPELRESCEFGAHEAAFRIGVLDPMIMRTSLYEAEAVKIKAGDVADIVFSSIPGRTFTGTVNRISWAPSTPRLEDPSYYDVELLVPNEDLTLKPGFKGIVTFQVDDGEKTAP